MIYLYIFISMILLTLAEFGFVISFKHPIIVARFLRLPRSHPAPKIIFGTSMFIYVLLLYLFLRQLSSPQTNPRYIIQPQKDVKITNTNNYTQIGYQDFTTEENYYFLYTASDTSPATLEKTTKQIQSSICKRPCTISFYDDAIAYRTDIARSTIVSDQVMQEWNTNNYVYVADHFLGYLGSKPYAAFTYYPYKDWYYKQQKTKENIDK